MECKLKLSVIVAVCLAYVALTQAQQSLFQFCDLSESGVYIDPLILDESLVATSQRAFPSMLAAQRLRENPDVKAVLDGARLARDRGRAAAAARAVGRGNRTRRNVGTEYIAASKFNNLCGSVEKRIQFTLDFDDQGNEMLCYIMPPQDLRYMTCGASQCNLDNPFPQYQMFRCEPDTYTYVSATAMCGEEGILRDQVFYVPVNCCCRRYTCNLKNAFKTPRLL